MKSMKFKIAYISLSAVVCLTLATTNASATPLEIDKFFIESEIESESVKTLPVKTVEKNEFITDVADSNSTTTSFQESSSRQKQISDFLQQIDIFSVLANPRSVLEKLANILADFSSNIPLDLGALGLPDLNKFEQELKSVFSSNSNTVEQNGILDSLFGSRVGEKGSNTLPDIYYQNFLIELTKTTTQETSLSEDAQTQTKENLTKSADATQKSKELAQDSQTQDVSQNLLRNVSQQLSLNQDIDELIYQNLEKGQITNALETQIMTEALEELSENNTIRLRERVGANKQAMNQIYLLSMPGKPTNNN